MSPYQYLTFRHILSVRGANEPSFVMFELGSFTRSRALNELSLANLPNETL